VSLEYSYSDLLLSTSVVMSKVVMYRRKVDVIHTHRDLEACDGVEVVTLLRASKFYGQATKGARWMPWQKQAMKDVASCDKLRGAAHRR
jgi:hypothetical protein